MRNIITILFIFIEVSLSATRHYVSPRGNDSNTGLDTSITGAWKTWQKAFNSTPASDTCYFLSGTYPAYSAAIGASLSSPSNNGTRSSPTCFFAYDISDGNYPILDCSIVEAVNQIGISIADCEFIKFRGLEVRNVRQLPGGYPAIGWFIWNYGNVSGGAPNNITFENCIASNNGGYGFCVAGVDTINFINCDSYNNADPYTLDDPGGMGNGFVIEGSSYENYIDAYIFYKGCRAFNNSDQGWGMWSVPTAVWDSCWAIHNGFYRTDGDDPVKGTGWKLWFKYADRRNPDKLQIIVRNCLAVDNEFRGFSMADDPGDHPEVRVHFINNFAYRNGHEHEYPVNPLLYGHGFWDNTNVDTVGRFDHWYYNNISYNNSGYPTGIGDRVYGDYIPGAYNQETNKFDLATTTITDADFISLDTTGLCGPRQADGSLPITTFGHLASTSECIDAGTDVGLAYSGVAPDIGAFEMIQDSTATDILTFTLMAQTGSATINTMNHTVSIEVPYGTNVTSLSPTIVVSSGATIFPASGVSRNFTSPQQYTVTAEDGITNLIWTVTVTMGDNPDPDPDPDPLPGGVMIHNGRIVIYNGKIVRHEI